MPKKCESCRFYNESNDSLPESCLNLSVRCSVDPDFIFYRIFAELGPAREICDREGDGIFVYFEPKQPVAGAAVEQSLRAAA